MSSIDQVNTDDGATIVYERTGSGDPVVLVHGITEQRRTWDPVISLLADSHEVISLDLRGHGESSDADDYSLQAMAGDVAAVIAATGLDTPDLIGHSLGGIVVTTAAAAYPVRKVINVDQPLALGGFKEQLGAMEPALRSDDFEATMGMLFAAITGDRLSASERTRIEGLRTPKQDVVLGIWDLIFSTPADELDAVVDQVTSAVSAPYLSLHGIDPGPEYVAWLESAIPTATVEVWADHGHYPHLVDPNRFADRAREFLGAA